MDQSISKDFVTILSQFFIEKGYEFKLGSNKFTKRIGSDLVSIEFKFSHSFGLISLKEVFVEISYNSLKKELIHVFDNYCNENDLAKKLIHKRYNYFWFDEGLNFDIKTLPNGEPLLENYEKDNYTIVCEKFIKELYPKIMTFISSYFPLSNFVETLKDFSKNGVTDTIVYNENEYLIQYFLSEKYLSENERTSLWNEYLKDERKASKEKFPPFIKNMKGVFHKRKGMQ